MKIKYETVKVLVVLFALAGVFLLCGQNSVYSSEAGGAQVTVQYPPDRVIMEFGLLNVSLEVPEGSADLINVRNNGKEISRIVPDLRVECFSVSLDTGKNGIEIEVIKNGRVVQSSELTVFRRSDLESRFRNPPPGFRKEFFHMKDFPQCAECHTLAPKEHDKKPVSPASFVAEAFDRKTVISSTSTCFSCHKRIATYPYVHGPVAVWSCLSCHDMDAPQKYAVKKPDSEVCFGCHRNEQIDWQSRKYTHGPVTIGNCAICHSPHAADYPFYLYKPTWDLCVNCHAEKGSGRHVLGDSFSTEGHPTRGKPDPVRIGKELSCASCHSPHASDYPHLWAFDVDSVFELCKKCHFDK